MWYVVTLDSVYGQLTHSLFQKKPAKCAAADTQSHHAI